MHRVHQDEPLADPALAQGNLHFRRDVDKSAPVGNIEPELFAVGFHGVLLFSRLWALSMILLDSEVLR